MGLLSTLFVSTSYFSFFHLVDIDNYSIMHIQILKKSNKVEGTMHTMGLFRYGLFVKKFSYIINMFLITFLSLELPFFLHILHHKKYYSIKIYNNIQGRDL